MSVVYLKKDSAGFFTIVSDGILLKGNEIQKSRNKLSRTNGGFILGYVGNLRINQFIKEALEEYDCEDVDCWGLEDWYVKITGIVNKFQQLRSLKENEETDESALLVVAKNRVFVIYLSEDNTHVSIYDETDSSEVSIGMDEYLLGAVWCGVDPVEALAKIIPHHHNLEFPIKKIVYIPETNFFEESVYDKEAFKDLENIV